MKIYTKTGDRGRTSLSSGERVSKGEGRIEAYGDVDELNSMLGMLRMVLPEEEPLLDQEVERIQSDLLHMGTRLATTSDSPASAELSEITEEHTRTLEKAIDRMDETLPALKGFILPGGHVSAAWAHIARTVCRRAERHVALLADDAGHSDSVWKLNGSLIYLNRLSDYLFVLARYCNQIQGVPDSHWKK